MARIASALGLILVATLGWLETASAGDSARQLHRPLDLPTLSPGEDCPVSAVDQRVDWEAINIFGGFGIGPGPVYPGISDGNLELRSASFDGSHFREKVFWYVKPSYRGPVLIRGGRLDGPEALRFSDTGRDRNSPELRIKRDSEIAWDGQPPGARGEPSGVLIPSSGCYGVQVDGTRFSRTVVFTASGP